MERSDPITGEVAYLAWSIEFRCLGPFILPSRRRRRFLNELENLTPALNGEVAVEDIRLFEATFAPPLSGRPRFDIVLIANGRPGITATIDERVGAALSVKPAIARSARNAIRFGDTDRAPGQVLLNHFASSAGASEVAETWTRISEWYGSTLGVTNSTLLVFDEPRPYAVLNYARVPGPVPRFMLDQLLRPSFYSHVRAKLKSVDARALPVFARRIS